jgi:L-rhamnose isomerase/sugar isomerase
VFRIFHEILFFEWQSGVRADIAFVIDQSHNLKGKIEAMIQTVDMAQGLYAKAAIVDYDRLAAAQCATDLVAAERCLQDAFATDVRPLLAEWRTRHGVPGDPLDAFRESGYVNRITKERAARPRARLSSYA